MRMDAGPVRIGSQGGNTLMYSLLDSRYASFEGVEGGRVKAVKGISLSFDVASFFFLTSPRFITGFSLDIGGFLLGYAHAAADTIDDEYFLSYQAGYMDEHFLFKIKLSHTPVSLDLLLSAGLSFRGLSFAYTRGGEAVLLGGRAVKESYMMALESEHLDFSLSVSYLNDPVRAGTFRQIECRMKSAVIGTGSFLFTKRNMGERHQVLDCRRSIVRIMVFGYRSKSFIYCRTCNILH